MSTSTSTSRSSRLARCEGVVAVATAVDVVDDGRVPPPEGGAGTPLAARGDDADCVPPVTTVVDDDDDDDGGFYYLRMDPGGVVRTSLSDSHVVFGALSGEGMIERYDVYRRVMMNEDDDDVTLGAVEARRRRRRRRRPGGRREVAVVAVRVGRRLNGHGGIVHGGVLSLLFDEAMGWACECLRLRDEDDGDDDVVDRSIDGPTTTPTPPSAPTTAAVTANLTVDFRAPLPEGSEGVIRVYHHGERDGRKIRFTATLESVDGGVTYAEASSLFVIVRLDRLRKI